MRNRIQIYNGDYKPNRVYATPSYWHIERFGCMLLDDGSIVVGKGTNLWAEEATNEENMPDDVMEVRNELLSGWRLKETVRFESLAALNLFIKGYEDGPESALKELGDVYVFNDKGGKEFYRIKGKTEDKVYLDGIAQTPTEDVMTQIPLLDRGTKDKTVSIEEFNKNYEKYTGDVCFAVDRHYPNTQGTGRWSECVLDINEKLKETLTDDVLKSFIIGDAALDSVIRWAKDVLRFLLASNIAAGKWSLDNIINTGSLEECMTEDELDSDERYAIKVLQCYYLMPDKMRDVLAESLANMNDNFNANRPIAKKVSDFFDILDEHERKTI